MGAMSSKDKILFYAIQENNEMLVQDMLKKEPELANAPLMKGVTTPLCRATYNNHQSLVLMLLQNGAEINLRAQTSGRTPLMWAAFRGNLILLELLITKGADITMEDNEGLNCFDIAVCRLQYEAAFYLYKHHDMRRTEEERSVLYAPTKPEDLANGKLYREEFDVDLFFMYMEQGQETVDDREVFYEKMRQAYREWLERDLVVDTRESWKEWMKRQTQFGEVPLVPREELDEQFQPHASFYNRMVNIAAGVDPTPRGERSRRQQHQQVVDDIEQQPQPQNPGEVKAQTRNDVAVFSDTGLAGKIAKLGNRSNEEELKQVEMSNIDKSNVDMMKGTFVRNELVENEEDPIGFDDDTAFAEMKDYNQADNVEGQENERNNKISPRADPDNRPETAIVETAQNL